MMEFLKKDVQERYHCFRPGCEEMTFTYDEALKSSDGVHETLWCPECRRMVGVIGLEDDEREQQH